MRSLVIIMYVGLGICCPLYAADNDKTQPWQIGYAEADITPEPMQVQMTGYGRERYAKGTLAPLLSQVLALKDQDGHRALLITADILDFDRVMVDVIRRAITRKHSIASEYIMLAASHTHWGPAVRFHMSFSVGAPNVWYMRVLEDRILACVDRALAKLSPGSIQYGHIDFRGIGCNRRLPKDGRITWGPYAQGSFDGHTPILHLTRRNAPRQLVLVGHACHPTDSGNIQKWSPAYPGAMRDYLNAHLPDTKALFVMGCGADAKVVAYANSTSSYIPDRRILREGGYEAQSSQQVYTLPATFTENIETEIKEIVTQALMAVKR